MKKKYSKIWGNKKKTNFFFVFFYLTKSKSDSGEAVNRKTGISTADWSADRGPVGQSDVEFRVSLSLSPKKQTKDNRILAQYLRPPPSPSELVFFFEKIVTNATKKIDCF